MTTVNNLDLIFDEWKAALRSKDRSRDAVVSNFEELFDRLHVVGATFLEAHALLPKAIKAHQPALGLAKNTYKGLKATSRNASMTEKEFIDQWNQDIADKATNVFFTIFPVPKTKDEDDEPKVFGNMSAKEYRAQRRYADQFPILNTEELERRVLTGTYNPLEDIQDILGDKDNDGNAT